MWATLNFDTGVNVKSGVARMKIGELSAMTGVSARSLRYYEQQGLLVPVRQPNGYREYDVDAVTVVATIRGLLAAGLSTEVIAEVRPCTDGTEPSSACPELLARVREVREGLARQADVIRDQTEKLDGYLAGAAVRTSS